MQGLSRACVVFWHCEVFLSERETFSEPINDLVEFTCSLEVMKIRGHGASPAYYRKAIVLLQTIHAQRWAPVFRYIPLHGGLLVAHRLRDVAKRPERLRVCCVRIAQAIFW